MAIHILIDGYNLIRNYPPLTRVEYRDFTKGREALLQWLARYRQTTPNPITVVFDGQKGSIRSEEFAHKVEEKILKRDKGVIEEEEPEILPKKKKGTAFRISKKAKREKKFWEHL